MTSKFEPYDDPYKQALLAAGAYVYWFTRIGNLSGTWLARISLDTHNRLWVVGGYGCCTKCDPFMREFGNVQFDCANQDMVDWAHELLQTYAHPTQTLLHNATVFNWMAGVLRHEHLFVP